MEKRPDTRMLMLNLDLNDLKATSKVHHALSTALRLKILKLLADNNYYVNEIAEMLELPPSTAALNVRILEEAGLISTQHVPGNRGVAKICCKMVNMVSTALVYSREALNQYDTYAIPIGSYSDCKTVGDFCGIASSEKTIGAVNDPRSLYEPEHVKAQLIWLTCGYLEYRVPNRPQSEWTAHSMRISYEACSEVATYNPVWPSDIFTSVNGVDLGIWHSPGDFGGRPGLYSPDWWPLGSTQFGKLVTWEVTHDGTLLNGQWVSSVRIDDLKMDEGCFFALQIGVHPDAKNVGGLNLFGSEFGDHPQDIVIQVGYSERISE